MSLWQAVLYFTREASANLARSWKISIVAVLTIAISILLSGLFYLATKNLGAALARARQDVKVTVYLEDGVPLDSPAALEVKQLLQQSAWVQLVEEISSEEAMALFRANFPSLSDLAEDWEGRGLPPSLEATLIPQRLQEDTFEDWLSDLRNFEVVALVDDDRDWLAQLSTLTSLLRALGLGLGTALLVAAIFTIASVVRLTAFLYLDEIAVMRMVGATEFYIRGPFYVEGVFQGLLGGALAILGIELIWKILESRASESLWLPMLAQSGLDASEVAALILLGAVAGLIGAVLSLRRETLAVEE